MEGAPDDVETVKLVEHGDAVDVGPGGVVDFGGGVAQFERGGERKADYAVACCCRFGLVMAKKGETGNLTTENGLPRFVDGGRGVLLENSVGVKAFVFVLDYAVFEQGC